MSLDETNNPIAKNAPKAELDPSSHGASTTLLFLEQVITDSYRG